MLDRQIGLAGPKPEMAARIPATRVARVERQRTVGQPDHRADILAEPRQHHGGTDEDVRVVLRHLERLPSEIAGLAAGCLRVFGPAFNNEPLVADRCVGQCRAVTRIDRDRLLEQSQGLGDPLFRYWVEGRKRAQVEIVGGEIPRWPRDGAAHLRSLQRRLDHTRDADRNLVLEVEYILQRAVEPVGP
jgi:hypothetical protein